MGIRSLAEPALDCPRAVHMGGLCLPPNGELRWAVKQILKIVQITSHLNKIVR